MKQVAPLRYDVIFKKAFGDLDVFKALVRDFLNIKLEISKVESEKAFIPPVGSVDTRFDLFAEDEKNRVIVEVQHRHYSDAYERFLYYQCSAMVETVRSSKDYCFPVTVITLVFFTGKKTPSPDNNILVHDFEVRDLNGEVVENLYGHKHLLFFVFTNSVSKNTPKKTSEWIRAIDDSLDEEVNENDYKNPNIKRLFELIEKDQITPEERARMKDEYSQGELEKKGFDEGKEIGFDDGYGEGKEDGIKEGKDEGRKEGKIETARNLKALGISEEQIASATGLSLDEVRAL